MFILIARWGTLKTIVGSKSYSGVDLNWFYQVGAEFKSGTYVPENGTSDKGFQDPRQKIGARAVESVIRALLLFSPSKLPIDTELAIRLMGQKIQC